MGFKSKCFVAILVLFALGLPFLVKGPDGRPMMTLDDWVPDISIDTQMTSDASQSLKSVLSHAGVGAEGDLGFGDPDQHELDSGSGSDSGSAPVIGQKMYKWQDETGRWHFSNERPDNVDVVSVEEMPEVDNVMEAPAKKGKGGFVLPGGFSFGAD